jgi:NADPH:quinone reductase-like Zn-dependent oxidoreductase
VFGVDAGIDTSAGDGFRLAVHEPVDVVLDVLGGGALAENLAVLAPRGRLLLLGLMTGRAATADLDVILRQRLEVIGTVMRPRGAAERAALAREFAGAMVPLFEHGVLRPVVDRTMPMQDIRAAHEALEANETFGKIVMVWDRPGAAP